MLDKESGGILPAGAYKTRKGYEEWIQKQELKEKDWFAVELEYQSRQSRNKKGQLCFEFPIITRTREDKPLAECEV